MARKIAIIGGSGFIGKRLCERLSQSDDLDFSILDIRPPSFFKNKYFKTDVRDVESLKLVLKGYDTVVNLAAVHKDDVQPVSEYYDVNVVGQENICSVMEEYKINKLVFVSSVAVYGFVSEETNESGSINPFNDYGKSKAKAESVVLQWYDKNKLLYIVRPTVVFGEGNRGNVFNLLKQIVSGSFVMIGKGKNKKSMAYVENVAAFLEHIIIKDKKCKKVCNYVDKPDFDMNKLIEFIVKVANINTRIIRIPYFIGIVGGYFFDLLSKLMSRNFSISSIRIKKFCGSTQFSTSIDKESFVAPVSLEDGLKSTIYNEFGVKKN